MPSPAERCWRNCNFISSPAPCLPGSAGQRRNRSPNTVIPVKKKHSRSSFAWPVSSNPRQAFWPTDVPDGKIVIAGHQILQGQVFLLGDSAFALNKNFDSFPENAGFWQSQLQNWLGRSADKTPADNPDKSGATNLPKAETDKGATP